MKAQAPPTHLEFGEFLRQLQPFWRWLIILGMVGLVSWYLPLLVVSITGVWQQNFRNIPDLLLAVTVLSIQSIVGYVTRKPWLVCAVFLALIFGYFASLISRRTASWAEWQTWWMVFFVPAAALTLNTYLFGKFAQAAALRGDESKPVS